MRGQGRVFRPRVRGKETAVWWLDYGVRGERHRESAHTTKKTDAQRLLRQRLDARETGKLVGRPDRMMFAEYEKGEDGKDKLVGGLRALVETQYQLDGRRSLWRIKLALNHLETFFGADRAMDITATRLDAYVTYRLGQGAARATVNRELGALRRAFRLAVKKGVLAARPEFALAKEDNIRTGFFEPAEFDALLAELPMHLQPVARFGYLTGWRIKSELLPLTWAQVDFSAGVVRLNVGTTKNGEGRTFPFAALPDLARLLKEQWAARDGLFVFHRHGQQIKDFYGAWHNACRRAAVQWVNGREVVVRPALLERIPHDFRRTAVRNLVRAGVPERVAMMLTGHKTRAVFERYNIVNERDLTEGVAKLAAASNGKQAANISASVAPASHVTSTAA